MIELMKRKVMSHSEVEAYLNASELWTFLNSAGPALSILIDTTTFGTPDVYQSDVYQLLIGIYICSLN